MPIQDQELVAWPQHPHDVPPGGRTGYLRVDDRQVHYLEWGNRRGRPMVCLHGGGQTAYMYEELGAAMGADHHVVAIDLPDHGDSDPLPEDEWTREALGASLVPVLDAFGFDDMVVVGASLGGIIGIRLAASMPDRIRALVTIDVIHRPVHEGSSRIRSFLAAHESFASLDEAGEEIGKYVRYRRSFRYESLKRNLWQRPDGRWEWKHGLGRRFRRERDAQAGLPDTAFVMLHDLDDEVQRISCPTLLVFGAESDLVTEDLAAELTELVSAATAVTIPAAGHLIAGDNPDSLNGAIRRFLDSLMID